MLPAVCARALRLCRPTRRSIVCCQQCAAVSACFFAAVSCVACKLFAAPDAAHYQPACEPFFAALRVLHAVLSRVLVKSSSSAKPDTKWPQLRARAHVHAAFQSSFLRWTGDFRGPATPCQNSRPRTIYRVFLRANAIVFAARATLRAAQIATFATLQPRTPANARFAPHTPHPCSNTKQPCPRSAI